MHPCSGTPKAASRAAGTGPRATCLMPAGYTLTEFCFSEGRGGRNPAEEDKEHRHSIRMPVGQQDLRLVLFRQAS